MSSSNQSSSYRPTNTADDGAGDPIHNGRRCDGCRRSIVPSDPTKRKLVRCSRCRQVWYHNASCQRSHYPRHKARCKNIARHGGTSDEEYSLDGGGGYRREYRIWARGRDRNTKRLMDTKPPERALRCLVDWHFIPGEEDCGPDHSIFRWEWRGGLDIMYIISDSSYMETWEAVVTACRFKTIDEAYKCSFPGGDDDEHLVWGMRMTWNDPNTFMPRMFELGKEGNGVEMDFSEE